MSSRPKVSIRPFSLRHARARAEGRIEITLVEPLRRRLWSTLRHYDVEVAYTEPDNPSWWIRTTVLAESEPTLTRLLGWDRYAADGTRPTIDLHALVVSGEADHVFDLLEVVHAETPDEDRPVLQRAVNDAFVDFACPWRLSDGMFFRVDSTFLEQEVLERATDLLGAPELEGAREEFGIARDHLTDGSARDAITYAAHSVESTLKTITGERSAVGRDLIQSFVSAGFMDDLPESKARAVGKALSGFAVLRNELGGHGQGAAKVEVPRPYAELAVHLAAVVNHFALTRHLRKRPPPPPPPAKAPAIRGYGASLDLDDELPF